MLILLPISLLILVSLALTVMQAWRPRLGIAWLVSAITTFLAWLIVFLMRLRIPETFTIGSAAPPGNMPFTAILRLDNISWVYAWALSASLLAFTFIIATQLTTKESDRPGWASLAASLFFGGLGLCAIFSGNLNTLILTWAGIDLILLFLLLKSSQDQHAVLSAFAVRGLGLFLAIGAALTQPAGGLLTFPIVNTTASTLVFLGAVIRLSSIVISSRNIGSRNSSQEFNLFFNLVIVASALIVITRGSTGILPDLGRILLGISGGSVLLCGLTWFLLYPGAERFWLWITGISALAVIAALMGEAEASLAWGIVLILPGSLMLFTNFRPRFTNTWFLAGLISLSTLPFTPAWQAIRIYPIPGEWFNQGLGWVIWLLAQTLLLAGYIIAMLKPRSPLPGRDRWVEIVYPAGLLALPLTHISILLFGTPGLTNDLQSFPAVSLSLVSLASLALAIAGARFFQRESLFSARFTSGLLKITPYEWVSSGLGGLYRVLSLSIMFVNRILEGEGGILWTLLFLLLLFALWFQFGSGG
jgi:hypothetical protein